MDRTRKRSLIRTIVLAAAAAAIAEAAGTASTPSSPSTAHPALADNGVLNAD